MSALNINSISTSSNTTPNQIDLKALQDSSLNGEGGFLAEAGSYYNAFFNVHFDKVYHFSHVEIGRLKMDGEFTFFPTVAFQVSSNVFESTSKHWTEFKTVYLDEEPTAITKIPLNFSAKNLQFMSVEGDTTVVEVGFIRFFGKEDCASDDTPKKDAQFYADKVSKEFKTISKGSQLTIPDFSGISLENFTQEGESSIVMTIPDLDVGNNRQTFITALQQARGNEKFVTWLNLNDIVFTNPTQSPITVTKMDYEYLNLENQWVSFLESEAGRNLGGYKEVYEETLKKIVQVHTFEIQNWEWFKNFTIDPNSSRSLHVQGFVQCEGKVHKLDFDPTAEGLPPRRRVPIELFPQPLTVRLTLHDSFGKIAKLKIQQLNKYPKVKSEEEYRMIHKLKDHEFLISCDDDFNKERVFVSVKSVVKMLYVQIHSRYNTKHAQFTIDELRQLETKKVESKTVLDTPMHKVKVDLMFDKENNFKTYAVKVSVETETNFIEKVVPVFGIIESLIQK